MLPPYIHSQSYDNIISVRDTFAINLENEYPLSATNVISNSDSVFLNQRLIDPSLYKIHQNKMLLFLSDSLEYFISDTIYVRYKALDFGLKKNYKRRELVRKVDESGDTISVIKSTKPVLSSTAIFGEEMNKSGSLIRGFTVGTTKDFSLNSGLRLQLSGKLTNEIDIVAALTDENTPIQPEGNTESLDELDKVFIEVKHPNAIATFGDYDYIETGGEFGSINRKLEGLKAQGFYKNQYGQAAIAGARGKFTTNFFNGLEGVQGPYRLTGQNNERNIIIIAGSEEVFIDGQKLKRGEANDYVIDYSNAEINFTPQRLITSASRINVDFEYTDRQFKRNFLGANYSGNYLNENLIVSFDYYRENDDENNPVDVEISDEDLRILEIAGDNQNLAARSGITLAQPDSLGITRGTYVKIDTTINEQPFSYYIYAPGQPEALYNVRFSYVGEGKGNYIKQSLGNYKFAGINGGSYLPIRFLPLPQSLQLGNLRLASKLTDGIKLNLELAGSIFDRNRFSNLDDDNNNGYARNIFFLIEPRELNVLGNSLGSAGITFKDRYIENRFNSLDRINEVEFERYYNLPAGASGSETLREFGLDLLPFNGLNVKSKYGLVKKGSYFSSNRYFSEANLLTGFISAKYNFDYVESDNNLIKTDWLRQNGNVTSTYKKFNPGIEFLYEKKKDNLRSRDSLLNTSLRYEEISPFITIAAVSGFDATGKISFRNEYFPVNGEMVKESEAVTKSINLNYRGSRKVTSLLSVVVRNKNITEQFKRKGIADNETILIRSQTRANLFNDFLTGDLFYETATLRTAKLERVFIRVPVGTGNFIYLGDVNENGIADEEEYEPAIYDADYIQLTVPTDKLFPVIDLKFNSRLELTFAKIFEKSKNLVAKILNPVSTETMFRVEENSREVNTEKIYLLDFSNFLNDSTTIRGFNFFQHDFHLYKNQNDFSLRFRYTQRKSLNQYSAGLEESYFRERSVRLKFRVAEEIGNLTEYIHQSDNLSAPSNFNRSRISTNNEISSDFSYRPERNIEIGFKFRVGRNIDHYPKTPTEINLNSELVRINYSIANKGRLRIELERTELTANTNRNVIPFEILKGNLLGKNYFGRVNFDYRVAGNLQTTIAYDARIQGENKTVHTLRAEARAFF